MRLDRRRFMCLGAAAAAVPARPFASGGFFVSTSSSVWLVGEAVTEFTIPFGLAHLVANVNAAISAIVVNRYLDGERAEGPS